MKWQWSAQCRQAFEKAKEALQASIVLVHYDTDLPLVLAADFMFFPPHSLPFFSHTNSISYSKNHNHLYKSCTCSRRYPWYLPGFFVLHKGVYVTHLPLKLGDCMVLLSLLGLGFPWYNLRHSQSYKTHSRDALAANHPRLIAKNCHSACTFT